MYVEVFKADPGTLQHLRWEFFATNGNRRNLQRVSYDGLTTNGQYLHDNVVTQPSLQPNLKMDKNGHALKVAPDTLSYFVDMFFTFFENANYFMFR